jgi:hypothetical protein
MIFYLIKMNLTMPQPNNDMYLTPCHDASHAP